MIPELFFHFLIVALWIETSGQVLRQNSYPLPLDRPQNFGHRRAYRMPSLLFCLEPFPAFGVNS